MKPFLDNLPLTKPTLLVDKNKAVQNIRFMAEKARRSGVRLRPHFKTHQSAEVGEWFRQEGVACITVSSVEMARYFARHGWQDITIAVPVNLREIENIDKLAGEIRLNLLVESVESVQFLAANLASPANTWIKIDTGYHRAGIDYAATNEILAVAKAIVLTEKLELSGILTHSGHTYRAQSVEGIRQIYSETVSRMQAVKNAIEDETGRNIEISSGDTPSCTIVEDLGAVDEIRAGNFVFFDLMQVDNRVCTPDQIAVALACPVIAKHPSRHEILLYGGAIHFSKESLKREDGSTFYGLVVQPGEKTWGKVVPQANLASLSQEHGILKTGEAFFEQVKIGDFLVVLPVHSCLTANLMGDFMTLDGKTFGSMASKKF
jgi:D-serine deaminase-like pyridoxal phosphate-dependent protein